MQKAMKLFVLTLMLVFVAAFTFSGGAKEPASPVAAAASGEPQYGGRITAWWHGNAFRADAPSPDIMDGYNSQLWWLQPIQEMPVMGDMEKYGPNGTGAYDFTMRNYTPRQFLRGCLLEDWETTPEKLIWYVRPGIYWQGRNVMESGSSLLRTWYRTSSISGIRLRAKPSRICRLTIYAPSTNTLSKLLSARA